MPPSLTKLDLLTRQLVDGPASPTAASELERAHGITLPLPEPVAGLMLAAYEAGDKGALLERFHNPNDERYLSLAALHLYALAEVAHEPMSMGYRYWLTPLGRAYFDRHLAGVNGDPAVAQPRVKRAINV